MADKETKGSKAETKVEKDEKPAGNDKADAASEQWIAKLPREVLKIRGW